MASSATNQLALWIDSLFRGQTVSEANEFIRLYSETSECWNSAMQLIESDQAHIRYFAANILYNKVRKNWSQLNVAQRSEVQTSLLNFTIQKGSAVNTPELKALINRVILALIAACIRIPNGLELYYHTAADMILTAQAQYQQQPDALARVILGLNMITALPGEAEISDISRPLRLEIDNSMMKAGVKFAELVDSLCPVATTSRELFVAIVKHVGAWLSQSIYSLTTLYTDHKPCFDLLCLPFQTTDMELIEQVLSVMKDLTAVSDYPRSEKRTEAVVTLIHCFVTHINISTLASEENIYEDVVIQLCNVLVAFASSETTLLSCKNKIVLPDGSSTTALVPAFYQFFLAVIRLKPRKIAFLTFGFWEDLQDIPMGEWDQFLRSTAIPELFSILLSHCIYPKGCCSWNDLELHEEGEDFTQFRDSRLGISEIFSFCLSTLGGQYFGMLQEQFERSLQTPSQWAHVEVVLYVLQESMTSVKAMITSRQSIDEVMRESIIKFIYTVTVQVLSIPASQYVQNNLMLMYTTVHQFLGSITFLLTSPDQSLVKANLANNTNTMVNSTGNSDKAAVSAICMNDLFFSAVRFVFEGMSCGHTSTCAAAAKAFHKLGIHGVTMLVSTTGKIPGKTDTLTSVHNNSSHPSYVNSEACKTLLWLVASTASIIQQPTEMPSTSLLVVIETLTRTIMILSLYEQRTELLLQLGQSIVTAINFELSADNGAAVTSTNEVTAARITTLLSYACQLIRFSDVSSANCVNATGQITTSHPLLPFLGVFWPTLSAIKSNSRVNTNSSVLSGVFNIYGKVLMSAGPECMQEVGSIISCVLSITCAPKQQGDNSSALAASSTAALQCATVLVESLVHHLPNPTTRQHLLHGMVSSVSDAYVTSPTYQQLVNCTDNVSDSLACMSLFGTEFEAAAAYFTLIHTYIVFCREDFLLNDASLIEKVLALCCVCLRHCSEKEPLRPLLQTVQAFFSPTALIINRSPHRPKSSAVPSDSNNKEHNGHNDRVQMTLLNASRHYGHQLTVLLLNTLSAARVEPALVPNLTDTLLCLFVGCSKEAKNEISSTNASIGVSTPTSATQNADKVRQWFSEVIMNPTCFQQIPDVSHRELLLNQIFKLAHYQNRRFKALIQDVYKICASEQTVDSLLAYADL